jgi:pimeloyl-ACP methyl ester carboxylesterase/DNA-binding CsgD family transcriptional regulator
VEPETRYADSDGIAIAYRVFGRGPVDVVMVPGFISHVEYAWEEPVFARFLRKLSAFSRVIMFDKRGMGLSDPNPSGRTPTLAERIDDIRAVMDAAGSERAAMFAWSEGGPTAVELAYVDPGRVLALILVGTTARFTEDEGYDALPRDLVALAIEVWRAEWGSGVGLELYGPSVADDPRMRRWWAGYQRLAASPGAVSDSLRMHLNVDVRGRLSHIRAPTLILHRVDDMLLPVTCARYMATHISGASFIEMRGNDHMYWLGDQEEVLTAVRSFLSGTPEGTDIKRIRQRRGRASFGWESLTEAELDVVRLVAEGFTNEDIGRRLHKSPRTVQTQLRQVGTKLGVRRRAEIVAEATRRLS